jgi:hypothetical protein
MNEYTNIGKIDIKKIGKYKKKIITTELILTQERLNHHIYKYHEKEYIEIKSYIKYIIDNPDYILEDNKNIDTLIYLKHIEEINKKARVVIKLATNKNDKIYNKNSIITIMRQRDKSWEQTLKNRGTIIYKKLDKDE